MSGSPSLSQVREAAIEVGISPEFIARALAEGDEADTGPGDRVDRWAERLSGPGPRSLVVSREFDSPIDEVYAAVQRVFPRHHLVLVDSHGQPLEGGQLVYALPSAGVSAADFIVADLATRARVETNHLRSRRCSSGRRMTTASRAE